MNFASGGLFEVGGNTMTFPTTAQTIPGLAQANTFGSHQTFSALVSLSGNGVASNSTFSLGGTPFTGGTGTTTFPYMGFNQGTAATTWSTAGTELGMNAPSGFVGNLLDFRINGGSPVATLDYQGNLTVASCTGCGSGGSGANTTLSNLTSPTALNEPLNNNTATYQGSAFLNLGGTAAGGSNIADWVDQTTGNIFRSSISGAYYNTPEVWDPVIIMGWNCAQGGGRISTSWGAFCLQFEGDYQTGGSNSDTLEYHNYYITGAGTYYRPFTQQFNYDLGVDDFTTYNLNAGVSYKCLTSACALGGAGDTYFSFNPTAVSMAGATQIANNLTVAGGSSTNGLLILATDNNTIGGASPTNNFQMVNSGISGTCPTLANQTWFLTGIDAYTCPAASSGTAFTQIGTTAVQHVGLFSDLANLPLGVNTIVRPANAGAGLVVAPNWTADTNWSGHIQTTNGGGSAFYDMAYVDGSGGPTAITDVYTCAWTGIKCHIRDGATEMISGDGSGDLNLVSGGGTVSFAGTAGVTAGSFSAITAIQAKLGGVITLTGTSDARLKNIQGSFNRGLEAIMALSPQLYRWNEEGQKITGFPADLTQAGFIAQNVQAAIPEAIGHETHDGVDYLTLADRPIVAALVNAVKEQQQEIEQLKAQVQSLSQSGILQPAKPDEPVTK
jgi:hypothetical protein